MSEVITKRESIKNLASLLNDSLASQTTSKRYESMNKEKRVINSNFLASTGTFTDFRLEAKNTDFAHFRLITDKQDEISLNALSLICYQNDPDNITFRDYDGKNVELQGYGLLQNTKPISKIITKHLSKLRAKNELEVVLSYMNCNFRARAKKVYTYFPNIDETDATDANSETLNAIDDKLTIVNVKDAFEITELNHNKKTFNILKSTYFLELDDDEKEAIKEALKEEEKSED